MSVDGVEVGPVWLVSFVVPVVGDVSGALEVVVADLVSVVEVTDSVVLVGAALVVVTTGPLWQACAKAVAGFTDGGVAAGVIAPGSW